MFTVPPSGASEYTNGELGRRITNLESEKAELFTRLKVRENQLAALRTRCETLENDNNHLRTHIASISTAQEPLYEEQYYTLLWDQINIDIESWVAKETKMKVTEALSEATQQAIISKLLGLGETVKSHAKGVKLELLTLGTGRGRRIALIRHVIALFLFYAILEKFTFGFDAHSSAYLEYIEREIYTQGYFTFE